MLAVRALCFVALLLVVGCATSPPPGQRPFDFRRDTFSYSNGLVWEYRLDVATGRVITSKREPPPTHAHHCFVMVRAARQFFDHARFEPTLPRLTNYTGRVREVMRHSPRKTSEEEEKVVIPGYTNLHEFSREHAELLQSECGGAWQSYFQRGHWRMVFPFTKRHQGRTAKRLLAGIEQHRPQIIHVVRFPSLAINHALLLYDAEKDDNHVRFFAYDANDAETPTTLTFDRAKRRFSLPPNPYFPRGGRVDVYPIFVGLCY